MLMDAVQAQMQLYTMVSGSQIPVFTPDNTTQHTASPIAVPAPGNREAPR